MTSYTLEAIGHVTTCFPDKFGIPRQSGLAPSAWGTLVMEPQYSSAENFEGLADCSHLWVTFLFHHSQAAGWKSKVRPPRLGGNAKRGVFATRSPFRPNFLGQSVVALEGIECDVSGARLQISGVDVLDGTPVLDIKPYVPYCDCVLEASNGFAPEAPEHLRVVFHEEAEARLQEVSATRPAIKPLIVELLRLDPRPAYQQESEGRLYRMTVDSYTVTWTCRRQSGHRVMEVIAIE